MRKYKKTAVTTIRAVKAEMNKPRQTASVRDRSSSGDHPFELTGYGRARSALDRREFRVEYAMKFVNPVPARNGMVPPAFDTGCTECFIQSVNKAVIPDGDYILYFDNDGAHHVRKASGQWVYLAITEPVLAAPFR